jgi:hypothetical protein
MGITIKRATWGDEKATTDITASMVEKAKPGYLDVVADNKLVPAVDLLTGTKDISIDDSEMNTIKQDAVKNCGGAQDQKCVDYQVNMLQSSLLQQKVAESQSSANIVTGRRLTLTYIDDKNIERQVAIPDGQQVKFGEKPKPSYFSLPSISWSVFAGVGTTFLYFVLAVLGVVHVYAVASTYRTFAEMGLTTAKIVLTAIAAIIPLSGLLITPLGVAYLQKVPPKV